MHLIGHIAKADARFWTAEVPAAGVYTQGTSVDDARAMLADALESLVDAPRFKVQVSAVASDGTVLVTSNQTGALIAYLLKHSRATSGMSLADVAAQTGKARNNYAQYEQGNATPSIEKLQEFLEVVAPGLVIAIIPKDLASNPARSIAPLERSRTVEARLQTIEAMLRAKAKPSTKKPVQRQR